MNAPTIVLPLLLLLFSPAAASSALAPAGAVESSPDVYMVFVSRADYIDSVDYDLRLLASVTGRLMLPLHFFLSRPWIEMSTHLSSLYSATEAKLALLYHYGGIGFAARLASKHADQLSSERS
jgi:hypothetical protein